MMTDKNLLLKIRDVCDSRAFIVFWACASQHPGDKDLQNEWLSSKWSYGIVEIKEWRLMSFYWQHPGTLYRNIMTIAIVNLTTLWHRSSRNNVKLTILTLLIQTFEVSCLDDIIVNHASFNHQVINMSGIVKWYRPFDDTLFVTLTRFLFVWKHIVFSYIL